VAQKRKRSTTNVLLPWERRRAWFAELRSGRRVRALLLLLALFGFVHFSFRVAGERTRVRTTRASIAEVQRAITAFRAEMGRCPRSKAELVHPPRTGAHYLDEVPNDGWGQELFIRCPAPRDPSSAEVISAGPSGSFSIDDNVL
jgi:hypothetical protein